MFDLKSIPETSGVYKISNIVTGECYIGGTGNLRRRASEHATTLRGGMNGSCLMQQSYNVHGPRAFRFETVTTCDPADLPGFERVAIIASNAVWNSCKRCGRTQARTAPSPTPANHQTACLFPHVVRERQRSIAADVKAGISDRAIADKHSVSAVTVAKIRLCIVGIEHKRGRQCTDRWNAVDWTKRTGELAKLYGVTCERIRQLRKQFDTARIVDRTAPATAAA